MLKQGTLKLKATLRSPYDDQKAQALLLDPYCSSRIRLAIGVHPSKQRSNMTDHIIGSGDHPV
jgi:hypothetical protein